MTRRAALAGAALCCALASARAQAASGDSAGTYPGFDISMYPGDSILQAWKHPASPFRWVGYYLVAPCHRDSSWTGRRAALEARGWGTAAIYVGQQDWSQMAVGRATPHARSDSTGAPAICSASLLTADRGRADAADAVRRMSADGFPDGSTVFLNVELVAAVTPALAAYVRAWLANVLSGGRYRPGVYAVKKNAESLHDIAVDVYRAAGRADRAPFWISSGGPFALTSAPADVGVSYADIWQGMFGVAQQYNGVRLIVDVNVANRSSPGAP